MSTDSSPVSEVLIYMIVPDGEASPGYQIVPSTRCCASKKSKCVGLGVLIGDPFFTYPLEYGNVRNTLRTKVGNNIHD